MYLECIANILFRRQSSQLSLRQSATINNQNAIDQLNLEKEKLELQRQTAEVRKLEIENERAELELWRLRREMQKES